jgi:PhoD-like phosphatase
MISDGPASATAQEGKAEGRTEASVYSSPDWFAVSDHARHPLRYSYRAVDRRTFLKRTGRSVLLAGAVASSSSCDLFSSDEAIPKSILSYGFDGSGKGWSGDWLNVRYAGHWERRRGEGIVRVGPAPGRAVDDALQTEYMAQPIVLASSEISDVEVSVSVATEGFAEGGVIARWDHDRAYALLIRSPEVLLVRYAIDDRRILRRSKLPGQADRWRLKLSVAGGRLVGRAEAGEESVVLGASDPDPLRAGAVGVVANPTNGDAPGTARFRSFRAASTQEPSQPEERFVYRFAGAIVAGDGGAKARLTARTVYPRPLGFEIARNRDFSDPVVIAPAEPEGKWGSVHAWAEALDEGILYFWRPFVSRGDSRVVGPSAHFRTPAFNREVRFVFASCTSGRTTDYSSFARAASFAPEFYLHAGDWGYPDLTSLAHSPDHFQHRWTRLLRTSEVDELIEGTPLMFWQDDHDYRADNGWAETCQPFTIWSFDELHSNPSDTYFDLRWGDLHVWCLDCRLFATDPGAADDASKSRLGEEQKQWLREGMAASDAPVRVVASGMVFRNKDPKDKGWHNVYQTERDELLDFFRSLDATVFILSGDSHGHRLIHHFEFGELYEITASGTDFPETSRWGKPNFDPEHTLHHIDDRTGFAVIDLDPPGEGREVRIRSVSTHSGETMFEKALPVPSG